MRSRNIKPAFFKNEALSECSMGARLTFIGLWCLADRNGLLENRPKRINAELFPYEPSPLLNGYLTELERLGFIEYKKGGTTSYIFIPKFTEHQHPHNTETTKLPHPKSLESISNQNINGDLTVTQPLSNGYRPADSLLLNTDSLLLNPSIPDNGDLLSDIETTVANAPIDSVDGHRDSEVSNLEQTIEYDDDLYAKKKDTKKSPQVAAAPLLRDAREVLDYLNEKAGRNYRHVGENLKMIAGRLKSSTVEECKAIIEKKCRDWLGDEKMSQYLRPATIFNATKFAQYQGELQTKAIDDDRLRLQRQADQIKKQMGLV